MDINDIKSYIDTDVKAIQHIAWEAAADPEHNAIYMHIIDVLAEHVIQMTGKIEGHQAIPSQ